MVENLRIWTVSKLKWLEKYTKTDMVYLVTNSFWVNANTVITNIFAFVLSIIFARYVSKDVYGTYQFLISISSVIGGMTLIGMNNAVTQAVARGFEGVFERSIKEQLKFSLIPFFMGIAGSVYYLIYGNIGLSVSIIIIALLLPVSNTFNTWTAYLSGKKDFKDLFLYSQILNVSYYGILILTIVILPKTLFLILANFLCNAIANIIIYFLVVKKHKPHGHHEPEALSYGKKLSVSSILPMIALNIDNLIIFHFLGPMFLAIYAFASNIPERLGSLLRPISTIAFPKFSEKTPEEIRKILPKKTLQLFLLSLIGCAVYIALSPFLFRFLFPQYTDSIFYSQMYALAVVISSTASLPIMSLFATRSRKIYNFNLVNSLFNIAIIFIFIYFFGIWGAILAKIVGNAFSLFYSLSLKETTQ